MKHIIWATILVLILFPGVVFSQEGDHPDFPPGTYVFHLYFDSGKLAINRDAEFSYDVTVDVHENRQGEYRVDIVNILDKVATQTIFNPTPKNSNLTKGVIDVYAPYQADGKEARFYNQAGELLLTIPVQESSFCDDDGACEEVYGEDYLNCSNDCKNTDLVSVPGEDGQDGQETGQEDGRGSIVWMILGGGALLALIIYFVYWIKARRQGPISFPPK